MSEKPVVGKTYSTMWNNQVRYFTVLDYDAAEDWYGVRWDDGEEENLYQEDVECIVNWFDVCSEVTS